MLETLEAGKRMLVVVNDRLMHNHQTELAEQMEAEGFLRACTCTTLLDKLALLHGQPCRPYTKGDPQKVASFLSQFLDECRQRREASGFDKSLLPFAVATVLAATLAYASISLQQ